MHQPPPQPPLNGTQAARCFAGCLIFILHSSTSKYHVEKPLSALFLLALIPSAAANAPTYSTRDLFISRCTGETVTTGISRQSAANICACTFDQISSRYGSNWPQALTSQDISNKSELTRLIDTATQQCVSRHVPR